MQFVIILVIFNLIFLESNAVFMNGFQAITVRSNDALQLFCHEEVNETEITQRNWFRSEKNQLLTLDVEENYYFLQNITENTLIICQYTYYNYKYWFEIFLITREYPLCPNNEVKQIKTQQTEFSTLKQNI